VLDESAFDLGKGEERREEKGEERGEGRGER
jgi:hypothetical protein